MIFIPAFDTTIATKRSTVNIQNDQNNNNNLHQKLLTVMRTVTLTTTKGCSEAQSSLKTMQSTSHQITPSQSCYVPN